MVQTKFQHQDNHVNNKASVPAKFTAPLISFKKIYRVTPTGHIEHTLEMKQIKPTTLTFGLLLFGCDENY